MAKERVLLSGSNGYVGNALLASLAHDNPGHEFFCVDHAGRKRWVQESGGISLTDYADYAFFAADLSNAQEAARILNYFKPSVIMHLASQPSAPYSEISLAHRSYTQQNNLQMLLNLITLSHELKLNPKFIVTTTTGVPGAPDQPIEEGPMTNLAGSSYHVSRGFDSANLALAARQWKFRILEMRTAIVYGTRVDGISQPVTRLDWDYYFGTVIHRFALRTKMNLPITVYGKGEQKKPLIALRDVVKSLRNAIECDIKPGHEIVNQVTECLSVMKMAQTVAGDNPIENIPNPRIEKESHQMVINNAKFMKILYPGLELFEKDGITMAHGCNSTLLGEIDNILKDIDLSKLPFNWLDIFEGKIKQGVAA